MIRFLFQHRFGLVEVLGISVATHLISDGFWIAALIVVVPASLISVHYQDAANA